MTDGCHAHDVFPDHVCTDLCSHNTCCPKSQAARDAKRARYGDESYWQYLDEAAQEHYDYFAARGDLVTAESMWTQSLSDALRGNDGD